MDIDFSNLPNENSKRFVAILNKKVEIGRLLNALGHMTAGLAGGFSNSGDLCLLPYEDKDGNKHPNISHFPFIVLKADNSNQLKTIRQEAINRNIPFTDFTDTMTVGTSEDQVNATKSKTLEELELYGVCLFGITNELREFTKKFSLFK